MTDVWGGRDTGVGSVTCKQVFTNQSQFVHVAAKEMEEKVMWLC